MTSCARTRGIWEWEGEFTEVCLMDNATVYISIHSNIRLRQNAVGNPVGNPHLIMENVAIHYARLGGIKESGGEVFVKVHPDERTA